MTNINLPDAVATAAAVRSAKQSAKALIETTLARIAKDNELLNCFTVITDQSAIAQAEQIDADIAQGKDPGSLAGVPFAVKNLFDIAGVTTLAGSKINQEHPPAVRDATAIARLKRSGAVLMGALNMDEYAYGFVTENSHYGATPNPHDPSRIAGGSSGGSAVAVAAGLVPLTLGSDTNGSIRVPAALCGVYGLRPTYGRLSRAGTVLFAHSLDCIGPFARSVRDLATVFDVLQGADPLDPVCRAHPLPPTLPQLERGSDGLRLAIAGDYFQQGAEPEALEAVETTAQALGVHSMVCLPEAERARAAAYIITAVEGASEHLDNLRTRPEDFDPATRDRFLAGALIPAAWYVQAQQFLRWWREQVLAILETVDVLLAPTTPCTAPLLGQETMTIAGEDLKIRPHLGRFTQPLSAIGLPTLSMPSLHPDRLPLGVQIAAAPDREAAILRVAAELESR